MAYRSRNQLAQLFNNRLNHVVDTLLREGISTAAEKQIDELEKYGKVLDAMPAPVTWERLTAIFIFIASLLIVAYLWQSKVSEIYVVLDVEAQQIAMKLTDDWLLEDPPGTNLLRLDGVTWVGSTLIDREIDSPFDDAGLEVTGQAVWIKHLWIEKDSSLEIRRREQELQLKVRDGSVEGVLAVDRPKQLLIEEDGEETESNLPSPTVDSEIIRFDRKKGGAVPFSLTLSTKDQRILRAIPVNAVNFLDRAYLSRTSAPFDSTVLGGVVRILEVKTERKLNEGDYVIPGHLQIKRIELDVGRPLRLQLEAVIDTLQVGPRGFEEDLRPSRLEYLSSNKSLTLIWASFLFTSGILWNLRKALGIK